MYNPNLLYSIERPPRERETQQYTNLISRMLWDTVSFWFHISTYINEWIKWRHIICIIYFQVYDNGSIILEDDITTSGSLTIESYIVGPFKIWHVGGLVISFIMAISKCVVETDTLDTLSIKTNTIQSIVKKCLVQCNKKKDFNILFTRRASLVFRKVIFPINESLL